MQSDNKTDSYVTPDVLSPSFFCLDFYQKRKKGKYRLINAPETKHSVADTHCHIEMLPYPENAFIRCAFHNIAFLACVIDSVNDGLDGMKRVESAYHKASKMLPLAKEKLQLIKNTVNNSSPEFDNAKECTIKKGEQPSYCLDLNSVCDNPKLPELVFIVGCHPHYAKDFDSSQEDNLSYMAKHPKVRAIGEIGLDFHYDLSPRQDQIRVFEKQLRIADYLNLPVCLHLREAHDVAMHVLKETGFPKCGTLLHCFNLSGKELVPWLENDCYIALGGPLTFKKSDYVRDAANMIPQNRLLTETDAPYMTPEPLRGDTCFPDHVIFTAKCLCDTLGVTNKSTFYNTIFNNAKNFFNNS